MWQVFIGGVWGGAGKVKQKIWTRMYPGSKVTLMAESRFDLRRSEVYDYPTYIFIHLVITNIQK